jgi:hypothetical protein
MECGCVEIEVKTCKNCELLQDGGKFGSQMGKTLIKKKVYTIQDWVGLFDEQDENLFFVFLASTKFCPQYTMEITNVAIPQNIPLFIIVNHLRILTKVINMDMQTITFIRHR